MQQSAQQHQRSDDDTWDPNPQVAAIQPYAISLAKKGVHVLELISPPPAYHPSLAGKTSLLHLLITHAVLPPSLSNVPLSGHDGAVIILDPLHHFSVPFLAQTMLVHLTSILGASGKDVTDPRLGREVRECVKRSLAHVHIFRPSSWGSLLTTLRSLEDYLFDSERHSSTHRAVHSIILEDIDAFLPSIRANPCPPLTTSPLTTASARLTHELEKLSTLLSCTIITTSHSSTSSTYRPPIPLSWPSGMQVTRLAVRRVEVVKFAPGIGVEGAEAERGQRWEVVRRGRFEAWKVGLEEGFVFRVGRGIAIEKNAS